MCELKGVHMCVRGGGVVEEEYFLINNGSNDNVKSFLQADCRGCKETETNCRVFMYLISLFAASLYWGTFFICRISNSLSSVTEIRIFKYDLKMERRAQFSKKNQPLGCSDDFAAVN